MALLRKGVGVAAAAVLVLAACSSSKKSTSSTTAGPATTVGASAATTPVTAANGGLPFPTVTVPPISGSTTTGVSATEIKVGAIYYKAFYADGLTGFEARIKKENDAGGVNGRKITVVAALDDGQDNSTDLTAAKTLVQQDGVFAVAPVFTAAFDAASYLNDNKVPFFGWSVQPTWCGQNWGFGFWGNDCDETKLPVTGNFVVSEKQLFPDQNATGKAIAIVAEDNDSARVEAEDLTAIWNSNGAKVVETDSTIPSPPAVVGDYTPYAEKIMTSNGGKAPDLVEIVGSVSDTLQLYKKLEQLNFPGVVQDFDLYDPHFAANTKGLVTNIQIEPFEVASQVPAVQTMINDLKAYDANVALSQPAAAGYWTADFLIQALKKAGPDLTREALYNAINSGFTYDYNGGGGVPVKWPLGHQYIQVGTGYVQANGTGFTVLVKPDHLLPLVKNPGYKP
ncbi:MAG TPA: ABC transporter substrate-binding protein [Acidimicrobiales bacterium]|nr:ABC transporter substrate-binding protein [Acidimicrobiales bacterium]